GNSLELLALAFLEQLHVLLELLQVLFAVGDPLLAPRELGQLPRDVVLLRDHPLLDLDHRITALAELRLELCAQLHGLLARLDPGFAPRCLGVPRCLVEEARPLASRRVDARAGEQAKRSDRRAGAGGDSEYD